MFKNIVVLFIYLYSSNIAQDIIYNKYIIVANYDGSRSLYYSDMDADGDLDILSASEKLHEISWFENDGIPQKHNWKKHTVENYFRGAMKAFPIDLDKDGDIDVLGSSRLYPGGTISWWENDGNLDNDKWIKHAIEPDFHDVRSVHGLDMDGDNDIDILATAKENNDISWWENKGYPTRSIVNPNFYKDNWIGQIIDSYISYFGNNYLMIMITKAYSIFYKNNWTKHTIYHENLGTFLPGQIGMRGPYLVYPIDIDKDGYIDILCGNAIRGGGGSISWFKNDGNPNKDNWKEYTISNNYNYAISIYATDLDGDRDIDVIAAGIVGNYLSWFENDGNPNKDNWTTYTIDDNFLDATSVYAFDIDGDSDMDVLGTGNSIPDEFSGESGSGGLSWWENDGSPKKNNWMEHGIDNNLDGARMLNVADLDGDGDFDILVATNKTTQAICWYENISIYEN